VRVGVGADDDAERDPRAADLADHVAEDRERGDDRDGRGRAGAGGLRAGHAPACGDAGKGGHHDTAAWDHGSVLA
jgi:hypothetical protein